jgi:hypothetical protein
MTAPRSRASTGGSGATGRSDERFTPRAHDLDPAGAFTDVHPGENVYPTQSRSGTRRNEYTGVRVPGEGRAATTTASTPSQRRGISRREWRVETVEDQSKDVARWQLEFTKMQRRAKAAEDDNTRLKATHDEMHARFEREHHARTALELRLKDVFAAPVVKEALASHPAGTTRRDDPYGMGNVLRAGEDTDGSETAMLVFKALEDRITRDRDALEAANAREVRLATMLRHSETSKLAAYAEAEKHRRELEAHVAKLRVDRAIREGVEKDLESSRSAEETLRITREKLATLTLEAETLRMNEKHREETQAAAVKAAVKKALDETVSEATLEAKRLSEALAKVRTEHGEQDWAHDRDKETTRKGYEHAIAAVLQNKEDLERELKFSRKDGRRADIERARVADEAAAVVEKAVAQREWALEVLDRAVDAEEEFAKHLHYEFYRTHLLAMPETAMPERFPALAMRCNDDARSIGLPLAPPPTSLIRTISALSCAFSRTTASTRASLSLRRSSSAMFSALWPLICPSRTETCSSLRLRDRRALSRLDSILRWRRTSSVVFPPLPSPRSSSSLKSSSLALLLGSKDASRLTPFFVAAGDVLPFAAALPFGAALAFFGGFLSTFGDAGVTFCGMPAAARAAG